MFFTVIISATFASNISSCQIKIIFCTFFFCTGIFATSSLTSQWPINFFIAFDEYLLSGFNKEVRCKTKHCGTILPSFKFINSQKIMRPKYNMDLLKEFFQNIIFASAYAACCIMYPLVEPGKV